MEPNGNPSSDIYVDFEVNKNGMIVKLEGMKHIQLKNQTRCLKVHEKRLNHITFRKKIKMVIYHHHHLPNGCT